MEEKKTYTKTRKVRKNDLKKPVSVALSENEVKTARKKAKEKNITLSQYISYLLRGVS